MFESPLHRKGGCSSIGRTTVCGTVSSLFDPGYPPSMLYITRVILVKAVFPHIFVVYFITSFFYKAVHTLKQFYVIHLLAYRLYPYYG